jgi:hypothetical protein
MKDEERKKALERKKRLFCSSAATLLHSVTLIEFNMDHVE